MIYYQCKCQDDTQYHYIYLNPSEVVSINPEVNSVGAKDHYFKIKMTDGETWFVHHFQEVDIKHSGDIDVEVVDIYGKRIYPR